MAVVEQGDAEQLKQLANGKLESTLNLVLHSAVKSSHVSTLESVLQASRYSSLNVDLINLDSVEDRVAFLKLIEDVVNKERARQGTEDTTREGERLLSLFAEYGQKMTREKKSVNIQQAYGTLEKVIEAVSPHLEPIEYKAAIVALRYLQARKV
jgi:hypothetical protein